MTPGFTLPAWVEGTGARAPHGDVAPLVRRWPPDGTDSEIRSAVIVVHGRGGSAEGVVELAAHVPLPAAAASSVWVGPQARGNSWYPMSFLVPVERNEPGRSSGLEVLGRIMEDLEAAGIPRPRILVGGFSQGACLALEFAAHQEKALGGIFALSGGLIGPPGELTHYPGALGQTPVFLGCSDVDPHIPVERVRESAEIMEGLGATVDLRIYPGMGHTVNRDELVAVGGMLEAVMPDLPS